ncbi:hypothetical protein A1Q2_01844 [Trichosporon asahii var. asahii CBS 8904]|uniref:Uncharacterized protein n=2 Tax=Trichosporon asahii var. asahii TaxID=189963 RepID=K1VTE2_TRIAC|nr:hypothetical protein A1Q1_04388 [Trichosporon asahii var. asahii CBS 2479]EJT46876.1 hypothetical protein A1Q1_04388 [Trichosporon asahii var. asahii CBS 2479]EKD03831.1 hypothetical protein A1Q2_01844 [Trichosporon asahii var. asahii CBS 8904]
MSEQPADDDKSRPNSTAASSSEATVVPWKSWSLGQDPDEDMQEQDPTLLTTNRLVSVRLSDGSSLGPPHAEEERTRTISGKSMATTATSRTSWQTQGSNWQPEERTQLDDVLHFAPVEFDTHLKIPSSFNYKRSSRASKASRTSRISKTSKISKLSGVSGSTHNSRSASPAYLTAEDFGNGSSINDRHLSRSSYYTSDAATSTNTHDFTDARPHSPDSSYHDDLDSYQTESESGSETTHECGPPEPKEDDVTGEAVPSPSGPVVPDSGDEVPSPPPPPDEPQPLADEKEAEKEKGVMLRRESTTRSLLERIALQHVMNNKALPPRPTSMPGRPRSTHPRPKSMALSRPSTKSVKSEKSMRSNAYTQPSIASVTQTYSKYRIQSGHRPNDSFIWVDSEAEPDYANMTPVRFWIVFIAMK